VGVVVLVVGFGRVECRCGEDLSFHFIAHRFQDFHQVYGGLFLRIVEIKNRGAVLGSHIGSLTVELGKVVDFEEEFGEFFEGGLFGIKNNFHGFGVARGVGADLFVGGIFHGSAGVA